MDKFFFHYFYIFRPLFIENAFEWGKLSDIKRRNKENKTLSSFHSYFLVLPIQYIILFT